MIDLKEFEALGKQQVEAAKIIAQQIKSLPPEQQKIVEQFQKSALNLANKSDIKGITQSLMDTLKKLNDNGNG